MATKWKAIILATSTVLVAGCMHISPAPNRRDNYSFTTEEKRLRQEWMQGGSPELSLVMSGGGIRSSLYNFGVLKALYDDGILEQTDLISSVSGGSYLSYWIYSEQAKHPSSKFASSIYDNSVFGKSLCEFSAKANFVTWQSMLLRGMAGRSLYESRMAGVFGEADNPQAKFPDLRPLVASGAAPYLIMNSTIYGRRYNNLPWTDRYFEMTPLHHGSIDEPRAWSDGEKLYSRLIYGALASGAAISPLKRWFPRPNDADTPDGGVYLWDGGKTENLGAVSALLRGSKRLIIIDAQFDSPHEPYGAYYTLQRRMANLGVSVMLDRDPELQKYGVYPGYARGPGLDTRIAYVKMEKPSLVTDFINKASESEREVAKDAFDRFDKARGSFKGGRWQCAKFLVDDKDYFEQLMRFNLGAYIEWADGNTIYSRAIRKDYPLIGGVSTHAFPRTTTIDQSFYVNQALAYIALGYLTAKKGIPRALKAEPFLQLDSSSH
ncbi:patatin-like phospholipase family protein [Xanthomonas cerealis]|nr:patatin-like phospholipase family protein [Xanthomonas translucens]